MNIFCCLFTVQDVDGESFMGFNAAELLANFGGISDEQRNEIMTIVIQLKRNCEDRAKDPQEVSHNLVIYLLDTPYSIFSA